MICSLAQMESSKILEAAQMRNLTAVKLFLKANRSVHSKTGTVLERAIAEIATRKGDLAMLKYVLEKNPSILKDRNFKNSTLLRMTITGGFLEVIKYLVDHCKAEMLEAHCLSSGDTYVHLSAELGHLDIFKYFIEEKKVDVNLKNELGQPLIFAAARGARLNIIKYIVEVRSADVTMVDSLGRNILSFSAQKGDLKAPHYLLDKRKLKIAVNNTLIIHDAIKHTYRLTSAKRTTFLKYFVERKHVHVNTRDKGGRTPLHWAVLMNQHQSVQFLIEHGAEIDQKDNFGRTSLHEAVTNKNRKICNYLVEHGANIQLTNSKGQTPLHCAASEGRPGIVNYLIQCGADVQSSDLEGKTPLHQAAEIGSLSTVKYLVQHGAADIQRKDLSGRTPAQVATNGDVIKYLTEIEHKRSCRSLPSSAFHQYHAEMWKRKIATIPAAASLLLDYSDDLSSRSKFSDANHYSNQINNFLVLTSAYVVDPRRFNKKQSRRPFLQDSINKSRMDSIAIDAVQNNIFLNRAAHRYT